MADHEVERLAVSDGRHVAIHRLAEGTSGRTVVLCHPTPGSGAFDPAPAETTKRDITLLAVDRPGYGRSDPPLPGAWASVSAAADDLATVLDHESGGPLGIAGWSAGGRVALALAARRPDLVDRVAVIATPAPQEAVPWIPPERQAQIDALRGLGPDEAHEIMDAQFGAMLSDPVPAEVGFDLLGTSDADAAALATPGARERLTRMLHDAFAQGVAGMVRDVAGYTLQPWVFEPGDVVAKTLLLYGAKDPVAGSRHATWWKRHLPDSRVEMNPKVGHLVVIPMWGRVLSHLAPGAKSPRA